MSIFEYFLIISILIITIIGIYDKNRRHKKKDTYIDNYSFPSNISYKLKKSYPNLSEKDIETIFLALKEYFKLCVFANRRTVFIPSSVLDKAWYFFITEEQEYREFCNNIFGRFLQKAPLIKINNKNHINYDLKIVWSLVCDKEEINIENPNKIPLIFEIDSLLNIPDGIKYTKDCSVTKKDKLSFCIKDIGSIGLFGNARGDGCGE